MTESLAMTPSPFRIIFMHRSSRALPGMGRRRRKVLRQTHRSLPKVFSCPRCGVVAVRITSQLDEASQDYVMVVACGNASCRLRREFRYPVERPEIDVYNSFVDEFVRTSA